MTVEAWMRARELRRQLAGMSAIPLPMNPSQIARRHQLQNELEALETSSSPSPVPGLTITTEPEDRHG